MQRLFGYVGYLHSACSLFFSFGSKGGTEVKALASHQCGPGSNPGVDTICGLSFVVGSLLCSERFFSRHSGFPLSSKPTFPNSNSTRNRPVCGCATSKSLFIYLIVFSLSLSLSLSSFYNLSIPAEYLCLITSTAVNQFAELNAV